MPQAHLADRIVLPARTEDGGVLLVLLDPAAPGVTLERAVTTNREIHPHLHLADVTVAADDVLVGPEAGAPPSTSRWWPPPSRCARCRSACARRR